MKRFDDSFFDGIDSEGEGADADTVVARRLVLVDSKGRQRAVLGTTADEAGVALVFCNSEGAPKLSMLVRDDDVVDLTIGDKRGIHIEGAVEGATARVSLHDPDGSARVRASAGDVNAIALLDQNQRPRAMVFLEEDGAPAACFLDVNGNIVRGYHEKHIS